MSRGFHRPFSYIYYSGPGEDGYPLGPYPERNNNDRTKKMQGFEKA